jgi:hypothetical protein
LRTAIRDEEVGYLVAESGRVQNFEVVKIEKATAKIRLQEALKEFEEIDRVWQWASVSETNAPANSLYLNNP